MKHTNKYILAIVLVMLAFVVVGCGDGETTTRWITTTENTIRDITFTSDPLYDGEILVSEVDETDEHIPYLRVEDRPFLYTGAQIRVDALMNTDGYGYETIELLFEQAAELGVASVQVPVEWKDLEIEKDVFDFTYLDKMLTYANRYDLKMELLWFGTNMCGDTHSYTVPDYILRDGKTYPKLDAKRTGEFWNYYGIMWYMVFNDPDLMDREANALSEMMSFVHEWDRHREGRHPVIGVQILNEADIFVRWRIDTFDIQSPSGGDMTESEAWTMIKESLDHLGKTVQQADYKVYTRTNFANSTGADNLGPAHGIYQGDTVKNPPDWASSIFELEGIDLVGDDSYKSNIVDLKGITYMYGRNLQGNFPHISENDGSYSNTPSLILTSVQGGGGYSIYDLFTSPFFVRHGQGNVEQGILTRNEEGLFIRKPHFSPTKTLLNGLSAGYIDVVTAHPDDFAAFNIKSNYPLDELTQTIKTRHAEITFSTTDGALAYAISDENHLLVFSTDHAVMNFDHVTILGAHEGVYDEQGQFSVNQEVVLNEGALTMTPGSVYYLDISHSGSLLDSTTWEEVGS